MSNNETNIIVIIIAIIFAIVVIWFSDHALNVHGTADRIWNIELFVLGSVTTACLISYIRKQRADIPPTAFDNLWDIATPILTGFASMQMYVHFLQ